MTMLEPPMIVSMLIFHLAEDAADDAAASMDILRAMLVVLGIVTIAVILVMRNMHRIAQRKSDQPTAREQIEAAKSGRRPGASTHRPERNTAGQLDEALRLTTLLDNKAERLEQLFKEADQRIAALQKLIDRTSADNSPAGSQATPAHQPEDELSRPKNEKTIDPLTRSVYNLADQGHSSIEIAQKLDEQIGKIDLILALRG